MSRLSLVFLFWVVCAVPAMAEESADRPAALKPANTKSGYLALILINETPFPGEHKWISEQDTRGAMLAILWVLHARIEHIPDGYSQEQIATVRTKDIIDVMTAGGEKGQCDGFYRDANGRFVAVKRVHERVDNLLRISAKGKPGRFARLINYAQGLADAYFEDGVQGADRYAGIERVGGTPVTGRAYSWMTDKDCYHPGGNFVRIPDSENGILGGNRYFTLRKIK